MADDNEFFREVNEDYRRDRVADIWKRYSALILAAALLLVASVGGWRYWQHSQQLRAEAASETFDAATKAAQAGKIEEAEKAFTGLETGGPAGYQLLARFRSAAEASKTDRAGAAAEYDKLAADSGIGDALRDLARLRAAFLRLDEPDPAPALASLQGLAAPTGTFRHSAREMLGLVALKRGDYEGAGRWFDQLSNDGDTPQPLRQRIEVYQALVAGGPVAASEAKPDAAPPPTSDAAPPPPTSEAPPSPPIPDASAPPPPTR